MESLEDNLLKEKQLSEFNPALGRHVLNASGDMGWNKRSSGNRHDSISGQFMLVGQKTGKIKCVNVSDDSQSRHSHAS